MLVGILYKFILREMDVMAEAAKQINGNIAVAKTFSRSRIVDAIRDEHRQMELRRKLLVEFKAMESAESDSEHIKTLMIEYQLYRNILENLTQKYEIRDFELSNGA